MKSKKYLNNNSVLQSTMRVDQQDLRFAVMKIKLHDLLMDLLLTMYFLRQTLLKSSMNKGRIMIVKPKITLKS